jgi:8-oxo-dGTP diphosphatase
MHKITQNILLFNKEGHILLLKHKAGKWLLPGGRLNDGENWLDGLKRELQEEVGIKSFKITGIVGVDS